MNWFRAAISGVMITLSVILARDLAVRAQPAESTLPLGEVLAIVNGRYDGEVTAAEVKPGKRDEETPLVYELRLLTRAGNVLRIRIDALSGAFLEIDGRGLVEARRPVAEAPQ